MGFFSWLGETVVPFIATVVESVTDWVSDKLGGSSYSGSSVQERVNVEAVLSKFKEELREKSEELEEKRITEVSSEFDNFVKKLEKSYPNLVPVVQKKKREVYGRLKGCIIDYAEKHISENDPKFQEVLEMQPGDEKKKALKNRMDTILQEAEAEFDKKLRAEMEGLNDELGRRLNSDLSDKEKKLGDEMREIDELAQKAENGTVNVQTYENKRLILSETAACLEEILRQGERER